MKKVLLVTLLAVLASACWGQSPTNGCLVVRANETHHLRNSMLTAGVGTPAVIWSHMSFTRVASVGNVPFRLKYSQKEIQQLGNEGVSIIVLERGEHHGLEACEQMQSMTMPPKAKASYAFKREPVREEASRDAEQTSDPMQSRCVAYTVLRDGTQTCTQWSHPQQ